MKLFWLLFLSTVLSKTEYWYDYRGDITKYASEILQMHQADQIQMKLLEKPVKCSVRFYRSTGGFFSSGPYTQIDCEGDYNPPTETEAREIKYKLSKEVIEKQDIMRKKMHEKYGFNTIQPELKEIIVKLWNRNCQSSTSSSTSSSTWDEIVYNVMED